MLILDHNPVNHHTILTSDILAIVRPMELPKPQPPEPVDPPKETIALPVVAPVTSPFGWRWGRLHAGTDFGIPIGTPVRAALSGKVVFSGWADGYGYLVELEHDGGLVTRYGHGSSLLVNVGQLVKQGEVVMLSGNTGRSTGPHLHFEVRVNGQAVNPCSKVNCSALYASR